MGGEGIMKRLPVLAILLLTIAAPAAAQDPATLMPAPMSQTDLLQEPMPGTDVRWFIWGVPPDDVIKYEKVILFQEVDGALFFVDDINGIKTLISYEFDQGRLWRVTYDFQKQDYPEPQKVIDDYVAMEILLNKRYGEPLKKTALWKDDYYKNKHNRWGLAVYNGHLELGMLWQDERTDAIMTLKAEDYDYKFRVVHTSRAIVAEKEALKLKQDLKAPTPQTPADNTPTTDNRPALRP